MKAERKSTALGRAAVRLFSIFLIGFGTSTVAFMVVMVSAAPSPWFAILAFLFFGCAGSYFLWAAVAFIEANGEGHTGQSPIGTLQVVRALCLTTDDHAEQIVERIAAKVEGFLQESPDA